MKKILSTTVKVMIGLVVTVILLLALFGLLIVAVITHAYVENSQ